MRPGALLARGRNAEVYAWGPGRVIKLYLRGREGALRQEVTATRLAAEAGLPVPRVHGEVEVGDRRGIVLSRHDEVNCQLLLERGALDPEPTARLLARLQRRIHHLPGDGLPGLKERLAARIVKAPVDDITRRVALGRLDALPEGDRLLHGDLHPGNLLPDEAGPLIIDWADAARGEPLADVARSRLLFAAHVPRPDEKPAVADTAPLVERFVDAYSRGYAEAAGLSIDELEGRVRDWLPLLAVARLDEDIAGLRPHLLELIENLL